MPILGYRLLSIITLTILIVLYFFDSLFLNFCRVHNHPGAQYESGSLRRYLYGRTDTIRSCSVEVVNMCENLCNSLGSTSAKAESVRDAINAHKNYANDVINGCGVDRHLLALKLLAKEHNIDDGQLFTDPAFQRSTHFQLSTSNVRVEKETKKLLFEMQHGNGVELYALVAGTHEKERNDGLRPSRGEWLRLLLQSTSKDHKFRNVRLGLI